MDIQMPQPSEPCVDYQTPPTMGPESPLASNEGSLATMSEPKAGSSSADETNPETNGSFNSGDPLKTTSDADATNENK